MEQKQFLQNQVEALVFASPKPLAVNDIKELVGDSVAEEEVEEALQTLVERYQGEDFGVFIELTATGEYQFRTKADHVSLMERLFETKPKTLSRAAQETLSIIAYRQPVTRVDIEFIRGVDAGSIIKNLLDRDLIKCVGRKEEVGRPMLFGTTQNFLRVFQISKISDLPPLESFQPSKEVMGSAMDVLTGASSSEGNEEVSSVKGPESLSSEESSEDLAASQEAEVIVTDEPADASDETPASS